MLNELYKLKNSLKNCKILAPQIHSWIQNAGKKERLILYIDDKGINSLNYVPKGDIGTHWKVTKDNQHSFPVFKLDTPILKINLSADEIKCVFSKKNLSGLEEVITGCEFTYDKKRSKALYGRIYDYPKEILEIITQNNCCKENVLGILITRLVNLQVNNSQDDKWFLKQLTEVILNSLKEGKLQEWNVVETIFFGTWDKTKKKYKEGDISLVLDIADYIKMRRRVTDNETKNEINMMLLKMKTANMNNDRRTDAYGNMQEIENDKYPSPNLPILGPTCLFSMFEEAQCHRRYKRIGSNIIPVGKDLLTELNSVLLFVVDEKRRGKTWQQVPSNKSKQSDLLISYLENKPDNEINIAGLFSEGTEIEEAEVSFEESSSAVCNALEGIKTEIPEYVQLIVLSKVDPGRKQVVLSERYETTQVKTSVEAWNKGAVNHPKIYLFNKNKENIYPKSLYPTEVMKIFHSQWIRQGLDKHNVIGLPLRDVYDVFLGEDKVAEKTTEKFLRMVIQRNSALLIGIGGAVWSKNWKGYGDKTKEAFLSVVSMISILLWKIKIRKEEYMKQAPFYVGRMLAIADTLHREYCINVRGIDKNGEDNSIPPSLIGNSLMTTALDNPEKGLARLSARLPIYQAWAQRAHGENVRLAKWALAELGKVSDKLSELSIPKTAGDTEKAQILLGYLARTEKGDENK